VNETIDGAPMHLHGHCVLLDTGRASGTLSITVNHPGTDGLYETEVDCAGQWAFTAPVLQPNRALCPQMVVVVVRMSSIQSKGTR